MKDPLRFTDPASGATPEEGELLLMARQGGLSATERRAIWSELEGRLALASHATTSPAADGGGVESAGGSGSAGPATGSTATATTGLPVLGKVLAIVAIGAALGGYVLFRAPRSALFVARPAGSVRSAPAGTASSIPLADVAADRPAPEIANSAPVVEPQPLASSGRSPSLSASQLREESAAVLAARGAVKRGNLAVALKQLDEMRQRFPHGALAQEREALSIEALAKSGARDAAQRRARAFLKSYPKSPYAAEMASYATR